MILPQQNVRCYILSPTHKSIGDISIHVEKKIELTKYFYGKYNICINLHNYRKRQRNVL